MARAKRTARADARRRYRAEQGLPEPDGELDDDVTVESGAAASATSPKSAGGQPARIGLAQAFRLSFRPVHVADDLRALPSLILNKALWIPVLLTIGSTAAFVVTGGLDILTRFAFTYFVQTPAIGGVFIAGFLAPRASWLLGLIVGLVAAICYSALILTIGSAAAPDPTVQVQARDAVVAAFIGSIGMGILFASVAAWYRRFLQISSPNRQRQAQAKAKRGADGRSRAAAQKAGARR